MDTTDTGRFCKDVEFAAGRIRTMIGYRTTTTEVLDHFWLLQDSLTRLNSAVDGCGEVSQTRKVITSVVTALESQAKRRATIPAVRAACEKINGLLIKLERATQPHEVGDQQIQFP